jgi:hypothetical protein
MIPRNMKDGPGRNVEKGLPSARLLWSRIHGRSLKIGVWTLLSLALATVVGGCSNPPPYEEPQLNGHLFSKGVGTFTVKDGYDVVGEVPYITLTPSVHPKEGECPTEDGWSKAEVEYSLKADATETWIDKENPVAVGLARVLQETKIYCTIAVPLRMQDMATVSLAPMTEIWLRKDLDYRRDSIPAMDQTGILRVHVTWVNGLTKEDLASCPNKEDIIVTPFSRLLDPEGNELEEPLEPPMIQVESIESPNGPDSCVLNLSGFEEYLLPVSVDFERTSF